VILNYLGKGYKSLDVDDCEQNEGISLPIDLAGATGK